MVEPKKKSSSKAKQRVPTPERFDFSRMEGPDPRDSRTQGYPCFGNHVEMPEGRGSLSGRNGHAMWKVCQTCRLRIQYVPSFGAKGCYRQAGPLAPDVETVVSQVKGKLEKDPGQAENLNSKMVSVLGAEESLKNKLKALENEKDKLQRSPTRPAAKVTPEMKKAVKVETADQSMTKRPGEQTVEELEAKNWDKVEVIPP